MSGTLFSSHTIMLEKSHSRAGLKRASSRLYLLSIFFSMLLRGIAWPRFVRGKVSSYCDVSRVAKPGQRRRAQDPVP